MFRDQSGDDILPRNTPRLPAALSCSWDLTLELNTEEGGLSDEDVAVAAAAVAGRRKKKKMLRSEQARALERSFEMGSKLEPERKIELARALGLPPRQVAIWFQNRRARWKTKRLEKDYEELKRTLDAMTAENEALQAQNKKLFCEALALQGREASEPINLNKETEGSCSMRSDNSSSDANLAPQEHHHQSMAALQTPSTKAYSSSHPIAPQVFVKLALAPPGQEQFCTPSKVEGSNCNNMFAGTDDQSTFWSWQEQQSFHH